jgi:hypothetical protein
VDISTSRRASEDEPIFAAKGGTVTLVGANTPSSNMSGYGNCIVVRHGDGTYALYAHLKDGSILVHPGQTITGGQQIALMGNTTNGNFSPLPGQTVAQWTAAARARGYNSGPMVRHLHFEIRRPNPDGSSPYPGPYPQSPAQAGTTTDPSAWLRTLGVLYSTRGAATIVPGSDADTSHSWNRSLSGVLAVMGLDGLGQVPGGTPGGYEPPEFERDPKWGITPTERALLATGGIILAGTVTAFIIRSRMRPNRRRSGPRRNRLRAWGSK